MNSIKLVFQVAGAIVLPIIMLIVAASPFDEPIQVQPSEPMPEDEVGLDVFCVFHFVGNLDFNFD